MMEFAEYVSLGHPDKIADYISEYLLDRYIEQDPDVRYAVEVQIKGRCVNLAGEVSSIYQMPHDELKRHVQDAICDIGYTRAYAEKWGYDNAICGLDAIVKSYITHQSPDIAQGLQGWGDQGIFFGYANNNKETHGMPYAHSLAKWLCKKTFEDKTSGLDIKAQVLADGEDVKKIILAMPILDEEEAETEKNKAYLKDLFPEAEIIINGTGRYVQHSTVADCGTTGRKLAVDFYGGKCKIGGGSPWTKDASKADLSLNLYARQLARYYAKRYGCEVFTSLACCIGKQDVDILVQDGNGKTILKGYREVNPQELKEAYKLNTPIFASMCRWGLFGEYQKDKVWEQ